MTPRNKLINSGRRRAEQSLGATLTWAGTSYPCTCSPLTNARRLNDNGGGFQLFDDCVVFLRLEAVGGTGPREQAAVTLSPGDGATARSMRVTAVDINPGNGTLTLRLNSISQGS